MRTGIRFPFNSDKAIASMAYILSRLGQIDKIKLIKLIYLVDRDSFLRFGRPITGDRLCAMPFGPVPSACLDLLNGNTLGKRVFEFVSVHDDKVSLRENRPETASIEEGEKEILNEILNQYGQVPTWTLVDLTHEFPEYREVYTEDTSTPIPFEIILKHHGTER